jgi:hypothetical protein
MFAMATVPASATAPAATIACEIPLEQGTWASHFAWRELVRSFQDRYAKWISATVLRGPIWDNFMDCAPLDLPQSSVKYRSSFSVPHDTHVDLQAILDDLGRVRVTRYSTGEVFDDEWTPRVGLLTVNRYLPAGSYLLDVEVDDLGRQPDTTGASAFVLSISNSDGTVLKRTANDGTWTSTP